MCNLSEAVEEMGIQKGIALGKEMGREQGIEIGVEQGIGLGLQQGKELGLQQGILFTVEAFKDLNIPSDLIISQLMDKFQLTKEEAESYLQSN